MPKMVENEVKRQINLIELMKELQSRGAQVEGKIHRVDDLFLRNRVPDNFSGQFQKVEVY